ncbi:hypothetical protein STEG23_028783 [Scotinomys teguina]
MEVVAAALRCQLLLIVLMAAMLLLGMKGSLLLVRRKIARTIELQESISQVNCGELRVPRLKDGAGFRLPPSRWRVLLVVNNSLFG